MCFVTCVHFLHASHVFLKCGSIFTILLTLYTHSYVCHLFYLGLGQLKMTTITNESSSVLLVISMPLKLLITTHGLFT